MLRRSLDEPIPGGARFSYIFGSALLFIFLSQIVTGTCLALYYVPSPFAAHASVAYIVKDVAAGSFLRSLHSYGSAAMLVVLFLHFLQTVLYGSYKGKRELLWIAGCTLALLVMGMAFTGYLLSWDQSAYSAGSVGTNILGEVPFIGNRLRMLMRGGAMMGALTISRFYLLHVLIIPALIFLFVAIHIFLFRKAGAAGPPTEDPVKPKLPTESFYPKQVLIDMTFVLIVMGVLGMLAHFVPVMLGPEADPANTRYIPRPEWYFLPMFQWLKYWQGWSTVIGAFLIPAILIGLLFLLPFMDRGLERRPWRRPIPVGGVLIVLMGLVWLGMTSRLQDSRDPVVAAQLAEQNQQEHAYFYSAFHPYSVPPPSGAVASTLLDASATEGKGIFDSHGCNGCHGEIGGGAIGPALTHISSQYPPAQLTALLKAPRANMRAAGMVPLTLDDAEMKALVSYLASLGGTSANSSATPLASGAASPAPPNGEPAATAGASSAKAGSSAGGAKVAGGKAIFDSHGCSGCHGASGGGGVGPALTHISSKYPPAKLTALLKAPRANMKAAGMVPLTLNPADMKALVSYVTTLGGTSAASAATSPASGASSSAPAAPSKAPAGSSAGAATVTRGKGIFDSQRCSGCHGASGGGGVGPALTHISSKYPPAKLTALLKAPRANMKAAGMVSLTLNAADMKALVSYVTSLGGTSTASVATPSVSGAASRAPAQAEAATTTAPPKAALAATLPASGSAPTPQAKAEPVAAAGPSKAPTGSSAGDATSSRGKGIFDSHGCSGCHGAIGGGGVGPALTNISTKYPPAELTALLKAPRANMKAAGMVPLTLDAADMKALVTYVTSLGGSSAGSAAAPPGSGSSSSSTAEPAATVPMSKEESQGQAIFKAHGCADCHGNGGVGGTAAAPALAGTGRNFTPALLTTMLKHPTARMQKGGMPPISLDGNELKALVAYVSFISASKASPP
ncbi:MAG: c-type cytochrome [Candidatus Acidiferrales bacterium]